MTAVDERVETIEHLDFEATCARSECSNPADWVIKCRNCAFGWTWCDGHLRQTIAIVDSSRHSIVCMQCGTRGRTHAALYEVLPVKGDQT